MKFKTYALQLTDEKIFDFLSVKVIFNEQTLYDSLGYSDGIVRIWDAIFSVDSIKNDNSNYARVSRYNSKEFYIKKNLQHNSQIFISDFLNELKQEIPEHFNQFYDEGTWSYHDLMELESNVNSENIETINIKTLFSDFTDKHYSKTSDLKCFMIKSYHISNDVRTLLLNLLSKEKFKKGIILDIIHNESSEIFSSTNFTYLRRIVKSIDQKAIIKKLIDIDDFIENNIDLCLKKIFHFSLGAIQKALRINLINEVQLRKYANYKGKFEDQQIIPMKYNLIEKKNKKDFVLPSVLITSFDCTTQKEMLNYLGAFAFYLNFNKDNFAIHAVPNTKILNNLDHNYNQDASLITYIESIINILAQELNEDSNTRTSILGISTSKINQAIEIITTILDVEKNKEYIDKIRSDILYTSEEDCLSVEIPNNFSDKSIKRIFETSIQGYGISLIDREKISNLFTEWTSQFSNVSVKITNIFNDPLLKDKQIKPINFIFNVTPKLLVKSDLSDILKRFKYLSKEYKDKSFLPIVPLNSKIEILNIEIGQCTKAYLKFCEDETKSFLESVFLRTNHEIYSYKLDKGLKDNSYYKEEIYEKTDQDILNSSSEALIIVPEIISSWHTNQFMSIYKTTNSKLFNLYNSMIYDYPIMIYAIMLSIINTFSVNATSITKEMLKNKISSEEEIISNILSDYTQSKRKTDKVSTISYRLDGFYPSNLKSYIKS